MHDHLAIAHVVFLDLRPFPHASQLHERISRVVLVVGLHDLVVISRGNEPERDELRISEEVQRHEIRTRFLQ